MAFAVGTIKEIGGIVIAKNSAGQERILKVGDSINSEETISTVGGDSHVLLVLSDGRQIFLSGSDVVVLDKSVYASEEGVGQDALISTRDTLSTEHSTLIGEDKAVSFNNLASLHHNAKSDVLDATHTNAHLTLNPMDLLEITEHSNTILKALGDTSSFSSSAYAMYLHHGSMETSFLHSMEMDLSHTLHTDF